MAVIVDDGDTAADALCLEAPPDATKRGHGGGDAVWRHAHFQRHRDGGEAVLHIMLAKHREAHLRHPVIAAGGAVRKHHVKDHRRRVMAQIDRAHIGIGGSRR